MSRQFYLIVIILLITFWGYLLWSQKTAPQVNTSQTTEATQTAVLGQKTKGIGCLIQGAYPDKDCTPGATISGVTVAQICTPGYSGQVRDVSVQTKNMVYKEYGITTHKTGEYEVDHFISLELGGSNDISNLWPEPADPKPGFHEKDLVENYLHNQVCIGKITLDQAQAMISQDWLRVYQSINK